MTEISYIPDHPDRAVAALLWQYRRAPRIVALVRALVGAVQSVEDAAFDLLVSSTLTAASGVILDQWGKIVGEKRRGLEDDGYRRFVEARILANLSEGNPDQMIRIFEIIAGPGEVRYFSLYPAGFALAIQRASPLSDEIRARIRGLMQSVKPAGVGITLIEARADALQYDTGPGYNGGSYSHII